jgi:chondroitin AC lyase
MKKTVFIALMLAFATCAFAQQDEKDFVKDNMDFATKQVIFMLAGTDSAENKFPHSMYKNGQMAKGDADWWTSGFFPGLLWYLSEWNGNSGMAAIARLWTQKLEPIKNYTGNHDVGFMINCSFGNAYKSHPNEVDKDVLVTAARSLSTRFSKVTGVIKSWNSFTSWYDGRRYDYPVIIDNMMNLELLFVASRLSGDESLRQTAVSHAEHTMLNQVRKDGSTFHVTLYDPQTGRFIGGDTSQGYASNSTWSRGQGWSIYGFTVCYRETHDRRFLQTATRCTDYFLNNANLPSDMVPWWDFNAHERGYTPGVKSNACHVPTNYRDASAAAIVSSALLELSTYVKGSRSARYRAAAVSMLHSLASPTYRAEAGKNGGFTLMHCTGALPQNSEIDVPLIYADYYFVEALTRYWHLLHGQPVV